MSNPEASATEWLLADLDAQIQAAQAAGDRPREATAQLQKALFWLSESDWEQAEQAFSRAADLAASDGRHDLEAQARYAQALVLERSPDRAAAARATYARAEQLFAEQGQTERVASIRDRLAQAPAPAFDPDAPETWQAWLEQLGDRLQSSIDALYDALASASSASADERARLEASRAKLFWLAGETEPMVASLEAAIAAARDSGNPELTANIDALRRTLLSPQAGADSGDPFSALLAQTMQTGDLPIAGDTVLQRALQALQKKEYRQVITLAENARRNALSTRDATHYLRYLFACIFIAFARDGLGDRPGVIAILLTCKATLEREGQAVFGRQLVELLDGLEVRWGKEALREARLAYRQQMHQQAEAES